MNIVFKTIGFFEVLSDEELREEISAVAPATREKFAQQLARVYRIIQGDRIVADAQLATKELAAANQSEPTPARKTPDRPRSGPLSQLADGQTAENADYLTVFRR